MTDNPFTRLADQQMVAATKARHKRREAKIVKSEKDAPMKLTPQEQELADRERLARGYRAAKKAEYKKHLEGPNGAGWRLLRDRLDVTTIHNARELPAFIEQQDWLTYGDLDTRQNALGIIAAHIILLRLSNGMAPMDDSLPGEELTLFEIIRHQLRVLT
jgi:hypothetical protein